MSCGAALPSPGPRRSSKSSGSPTGATSSSRSAAPRRRRPRSRPGWRCSRTSGGADRLVVLGQGVLAAALFFTAWTSSPWGLTLGLAPAGAVERRRLWRGAGTAARVSRDGADRAMVRWSLYGAVGDVLDADRDGFGDRARPFLSRRDRGRRGRRRPRSAVSGGALAASPAATDARLDGRARRRSRCARRSPGRSASRASGRGSSRPPRARSSTSSSSRSPCSGWLTIAP